MPKMASYLIRGPDGRMSTVIAQSVRGALRTWQIESAAYKRWLRKHKGTGRKGFITVKLRGENIEENFEVRASK